MTIGLFLGTIGTASAALSATTAKTIIGYAPYLTFDGGVTQTDDISPLLNLTIDNGSGGTIVYDGASGSAGTTRANPIYLNVAGEQISDISLSLPINTSTLNVSNQQFEESLQSIIIANSYWGDDDGDANPTIAGKLSVKWIDNFGTIITDPTHVLDACYEPYSVTISSPSTTLNTQYGDPINTTIANLNKTYFIRSKPKAPAICGARPQVMTYNSGQYAGPTSEWNETFGFLPQASGVNFPTVSSNGKYFDLMISGVDATTLNWQATTSAGSNISIAITPHPTTPTAGVRVTFTGPQPPRVSHPVLSWSTILGPNAPKFSGATTFTIKGVQSGTTVITYPFTIKKWYIYRSDTSNIFYSNMGVTSHTQYCNDLTTPASYKAVFASELTNSQNSSLSIPVLPSTIASPGNYFTRRIGGGYYSEWGSEGSLYSFVSNQYLGGNIGVNHSGEIFALPSSQIHNAFSYCISK